MLVVDSDGTFTADSYLAFATIEPHLFAYVFAAARKQRFRRSLRLSSCVRTDATMFRSARLSGIMDTPPRKVYFFRQLGQERESLPRRSLSANDSRQASQKV